MATELPKCELCGAAVEPPREYPVFKPVRLAGLCEECSGKLGGGPYSATAVREELRAMRRRQK